MIDVRNLHFEKMRKLPPLSPDHMCFGAGPANRYGLRMAFYTDEKRVYSKLSVPTYMNSWIGVVHGGIVSTVLDETMFYTALCFFKCFTLTKAVNVNLHLPSRFSQMPLTVAGDVCNRESDTRGVIAASLYNSDNELCAEAQGTFALVKSNIIRKLEILAEKDIRMIEGILEKI